MELRLGCGQLKATASPGLFIIKTLVLGTIVYD